MLQNHRSTTVIAIKPERLLTAIRHRNHAETAHTDNT
jgi:hypothetical protein